MLFVIVFTIAFILILAYIKIVYPFWNLQPVYHSYDIWYYGRTTPYIPLKIKPTMTKFCDFLKVQTINFENTTEKEKSDFLDLLQCYYIESEKVVYNIDLDFLKSYMFGGEAASYISFYSDELLFDKLFEEGNIIKKDMPIGCISSRPTNIIFYRNDDSFTEKMYFIDNLSIKRDKSEYEKYKIGRTLLQTHEYNQRCYNTKITSSLIRKEIDLYPSVVPLIEYTSYIYYLREIPIPNLPPHYIITRIYNEKLDILTNFINKISNEKVFQCNIFPDIGTLLTLIKREYLYVYALTKGEHTYAIYFIVHEKTQYEYIDGENTIRFCSSYNNSNSNTLFCIGFLHCIKNLMKYKKKFGVLIFDTIGDNNQILSIWNSRYSSIIETKKAYYTFNYIYPCSPISRETCFILL